MILGLTGKNAAGKGIVAEYLKKKEFIYLSLSDELREEAADRCLEPIRENLIQLGNDLREEHGSGYLATKTNKKIKENPDNDYVIDSIRNPGEIEELRKNQNFTLIGVDAPVELRFERSKDRGRLGDADTLDKFKELEEKENKLGESSQQLNNCFTLADKYLINDSSLEELYKKVDDLLKDIGD